MMFRNLKEGEMFKDPEMDMSDIKGTISDAMRLIEAKAQFCFSCLINCPELNFLETQPAATREIWRMIKSGIYPAMFHYYAKKGLYVFKFHKNFSWVYVIVDSEVKSEPLDNPVKNIKSLVQLMAKAYIKLYKSEENCLSSSFCDQVMDFLGLEPLESDIGNDPADLEPQWEFLSNAKNAIMAAELQKDGKNIIYPILDAYVIGKATGKGRSRCLKLFGNPIGIEPGRIKQKDGNTFVISYKEIRTTFSKIYTCYDYFKKIQNCSTTWEYIQQAGTESSEKCAGFELSDLESNLMVTFAQQDPRDCIPPGSIPLQTISFTICKASDLTNPIYISPLEKKRQISELTKVAGPEKFIITPDVAKQEKTVKFYLSIKYSVEAESTSSLIFSDENAKRIDRKYDQARSYEIISQELQEFVLRRKSTFIEFK